MKESSYLSAGFDENIIRDPFYLESESFDNVNIGEILSGGALGDNVESLMAGSLSNAFSLDGDFINDVINARLNTSTKTILSDFTFGATDYAGALKTGTIAWDNTGAITGGTGIVINAKGIIGALNGTAKFTLTTAGDAVFAGSLSAASGTLGAITIGSNAWHVDSSGNMWWGNFSTYAAATYKISAAGVANLSGIVAASVAAENITGTTISGKNVQSSSGNQRVVLNTGDYLEFYYNDTQTGYLQMVGLGSLTMEADSSIQFNMNGTNKIQIDINGHIYPLANATMNCGSISNHWANVFSDNYYAAGNDGQTASDSFVVRVAQSKTDGKVTNVQIKKRTLGFIGGILTTFGNESDWANAE